MKKEYGMNMNDWEEVPQEDLWQDGELSSEQVKETLYLQVVQQGEWKLVREKNDNCYGCATQRHACKHDKEDKDGTR